MEFLRLHLYFCWTLNTLWWTVSTKEPWDPPTPFVYLGLLINNFNSCQGLRVFLSGYLGYENEKEIEKINISTGSINTLGLLQSARLTEGTKCTGKEVQKHLATLPRSEHFLLWNICCLLEHPLPCWWLWIREPTQYPLSRIYSPIFK